MPVILDNGSDAIRTWLDPSRTEWSQDLQSLLKPYAGELECYPVSKDVGKVGNNSPSFLIPINSVQNKSNIANFFGTQRKLAEKTDKSNVYKTERDLEKFTAQSGHIKVEHAANETRDTRGSVESTEDNAPLPVPIESPSQVAQGRLGIKREASEGPTADHEPDTKRNKTASPTKHSLLAKSPTKNQGTRSATTNGSGMKLSAKGDGNARITSFFSNK